MTSTTPRPVLLIGGSGIVGSKTATLLRRFHPTLPIVISGRDRTRAETVATRIGNARAVAVDIAHPELGIEGDAAFGAVAVFVKDDTLNALRFAQARGVPYIGISSGLIELVPEVTAFIHRPGSAPIVLASHCLAGAAVLTALDLSREFGQVDDVRIGLVLDEQDAGGPAAIQDFERLVAVSSAGLIQKDGRFCWLLGDAAATSLTSVDGTELAAQGVAVPDVTSLALALDATSVHLEMAVGVTSTRRRGEAFSVEVIVELKGKGRDDRPLVRTGTLVHPDGMRSLTGLAVIVALERLLGLDGNGPVGPGLYMPETIIDPGHFVRRAVEIGARLHRFDTAWAEVTKTQKR